MIALRIPYVSHVSTTLIGCISLFACQSTLPPSHQVPSSTEKHGATSPAASASAETISRRENGNAEPQAPSLKALRSPLSNRASSSPQLRFPRGDTAWLGVELRATPAERPGVQIVQTLRRSPAEEAGLKGGDILLAMGEKTVLTPNDVSDWVRLQSPGTSHPLLVIRSGSQRLIRTRLDGIPEFEDRLRLALVGYRAPEIAGVATFQGDISSLSELRGQVVILEFWASYCGVCRYLAPVLDEWHRLYQPQGAHVIGITVDPPQLGQQVAQQTGMNYTLASDPQSRITRKYLVSQIPTVIVIDQEGIVHDVMVGYSQRRLKETRRLLENLLSQRP